jgi:hypothetical protein
MDFSIQRHLVGLLGWGISPTQDLYRHTGQHNTETRRHTIIAPSRIRTCDLNVQAVVDSICLSSVGIPTRTRAGRPGFDCRQVLRIFLFATVFRPALGPSRPPIQWIPGVLSPELKRPGREDDHSPPKECVELYLQSPNSSS